MILLDVRGVRKSYRSFGQAPVNALNDVYLRVPAGEITGLVGESGSGKSTTIRCILGLEKPDDGWIEFDGIRIDGAGKEQRRRLQREIQVVFQDPTGSLNPRMTAGELIGEGIRVHRLRPNRAAERVRVLELLRLVGLDERDIDRYPRSFSGGQRQRIAIARALAVEPRLLICDEAVSALDVSVQAQILNLLQDMRDDLGLTVLFVAHDLAVVRQLCSRVAILSDGHIVEEGLSGEVFADPRAEYTRQLLAAVPIPDPPVARARARERLLALAQPLSLEVSS
ncbi:peptide/nickel transport system ATP-binding protein/oligopeptide transport system ATP-binding protein [Jatrophihabitans sp. GAS493]|uniref:ATP-binding cassette domain-containing protein n=1 Tax=Jatrophihabitans sp. GAS493 TaxID=1907575 RepID=UPI000BB67CC5|nr:ABC transporter ATP-binding protein [Jatrophihabitans sp. GAS493]SOD72598.1 peptide/nickel transport system ATP-binding protein/oligopeptide transport system ATP-binding protein [Jatrophihabitans sp. GAS493]